MVRRVLRIVYKEVRGLHQAAYVLALFAFGSQLLALVRDRLLAHQFGAGYELDLYYAAFRVPDLLYVLFASTLSVYVLIPFVARARETDSTDATARVLLSQVFTVFLGIYIVLAVIAFMFAPVLATVLFPTLSDDPAIVSLMRILLLQPLFLGISSLFGVVTQLGHRFVLFALSPLVYNLGIIFGIVALYPSLGLNGLAIGVVIGAAGHMLIQWPLVRASSLMFVFTRNIQMDKIREVLAVSVPRAFTLSLTQIVLLVFVSIASTMTVGSVAVYQFAYNLQSVPLAVIGVSYSVAAFPLLAELFAKKELEKFNIYITTALRHIIFWSIPTIVLIVVLRAQLVRVVLGSGAFDWSDTRLTAAVLALLSISLLAQAINLVAIRSFYAGGKTSVPLFAAFFGSTSAIVAALGLHQLYAANPAFQSIITNLMRVDSLVGGEVLVLGLGYAIGVTLQTILLLILLRRTFSISFAWLPKKLWQASCAALMGGLASYGALQFIVDGINPNTFLGIFIQGFFGAMTGLTAVILVYALVGSDEFKEVTASFQKKIFKTDVLSPEHEIL